MSRGLGLGAADYITKPTKKDILLAKVKTVLEKRQ
jgi:DNA-binding response OmpR family regulator